ncbi:uncharacterized protein LOC131605702 [Vicia villosa]|uniref:uncharacterized protein LOC131605702 n=1 Tax=Vicia villosa TaxID=3911 RepID=UPI00273A9475|nr:uncharacterized protein LOC131605702 [Vicia villosa]
MKGIYKSLEGLKPVMLMLFVQISSAAVNIITKLAINDGMSMTVATAYRFIFASAVTVPLAIIFDRRSTFLHQFPPPLKKSTPSSLLDKEFHLTAACCRYQQETSPYANSNTSYVTLKTLTSICLSSIGGKLFGSSSAVNSLKSFRTPSSSSGIIVFS